MRIPENLLILPSAIVRTRERMLPEEGIERNERRRSSMTTSSPSLTEFTEIVGQGTIYEKDNAASNHPRPPEICPSDEAKYSL